MKALQLPGHDTRPIDRVLKHPRDNAMKQICVIAFIAYFTLFTEITAEACIGVSGIQGYRIFDILLPGI